MTVLSSRIAKLEERTAPKRPSSVLVLAGGVDQPHQALETFLFDQGIRLGFDDTLVYLACFEEPSRPVGFAHHPETAG